MIIALVPVRGGSKSIPLKNIRDFYGKPLVYWSLEALEKSARVDEIHVATDSNEIKQIVESFGFSKVRLYDRDPENATDTASTESVILEFIERHALDEEHVLMLVQATSPFIRPDHLDEAIEKYHQEQADSLLSAVRTKRFFWLPEGKPLNYDHANRPRRQDFEGMFMENGAFYINKVANILRDKNRLSGSITIYEMPEWTAVEIDEESDWIIAEKLMEKYFPS